MDIEKEAFRYFIRKNWELAGVELDNEHLDTMGEDFHEYLDEKVSLDIWNKIVPKDLWDVMSNQENPLYTNGFHPAYIIHFTDYVKVMNEQFTD